MSNARFLFGVALLVPLLGTSMPAEAAKDSTAARAACFEQAQAAANSLGFSAQNAEKQARGADAYRQCCAKAGIRP
jgi:hypothetical protein